VPDEPQITHRYSKRSGDHREFGYPLLRLLVIVECGTRALLAAAFGPDNEGELGLASRLLGSLDATMLVLADAGFDAATFLDQVSTTGARFLVRGDANRRPTITQRLSDGSYLARIGYRILPTLLPVRIVEATVTITLADGTERTEAWRLITNLLDHTRHPARELVHLYHERWQAETTYASIKHTILDGRVLRSRSTGGLEQEIWAVLATYQTLIRAAADATYTRPGLDMDRISFTVLATTAADTVTTATAVIPRGPANLLGCIGRALLGNLLPARKGQRTRPRTRKSRNSKYQARTGPHLTQTYTVDTTITIFEKGLAARSRR